MSQSLFQALSRTVINRFAAPAPGRYAHLQDGGICPERIAKPGHIPSANGCGAEDGQKYPDKIWGADFSFACTEHDWCYDTCNTTQSACDNTFCGDLQGACSVPGILTYMLTNCTTIAGAYCAAVVIVGQDAYESAQAKACICCEEGESACGSPEKDTCCSADQSCCNDQCCDGQCCDGQCCPSGQQCCNGQCCPSGQQCCDGTCKDSCEPTMAYCPCNGACYNSAVQCTAECPVTLGCFTNICGPAQPGQCG